MKLRISDLMDYAEPRAVELQAGHIIPLQAIETATLQKIRAAKHRPVSRLSKLGLIAAIAAGALCVTAAATAVLHWTGFVPTKDLSQAEKLTLWNQAADTSTASIDRDGNVHYYDREGNEVLVLTAEEAAAAEQARREAWETSILDSTELVDFSTMEFLPNSVTELATDPAGRFDSFMLGNGHLVLLHPAGEAGYMLEAGDTVTISLKASQNCYLSFGLFRDGQFIGAETTRSREHCYTVPISEDGCYCFSIVYCSADAGELTDGILTIS